MTSTAERRRVPFWLIGAGVAVGIAAGTILGVRLGGAALVLFAAFAMLTAALLLFQEALRSALDPNEHARQGDTVEAAARDALAGLETRKRDAMRALKDVEFEHSIGRVSDEDLAMLRERYRAEARRAMEAMDQSLGTYLSRAESLVDRAEAGDDVRALVGADDADRPTNRKRRKGETAAAAEVTVTPAVNTQPATEASSRACAACGVQNDADAVFCKKCGAKVGEG